MIFDLISQEDDVASARRAAGISDPPGAAKVLKRIFWRYFLVVWCLAGMALGLKALAIGVFLIWFGHPILIGMRLASLTRKNRIISDGGQHRWFVSMGGVNETEKIVSLKNVFFYSAQEMQKELIGFCRLRFLLYTAALLVAGHDLYAQWPGVSAGSGYGMLIVAMALGNVAFFLRRSVIYYRLLTLGQRQNWQVCAASVDQREMFAAYKRCQGKTGDYYVPYLLATFTPQVA
jgi:hypothetical protein